MLFRVYMKVINSIEYVDDSFVVIMVSLDCVIRVWIFSGEYIGMFGEIWKLFLDKILKKLVLNDFCFFKDL